MIKIIKVLNRDSYQLNQLFIRIRNILQLVLKQSEKCYLHLLHFQKYFEIDIYDNIYLYIDAIKLKDNFNE